MHGQFFSSLRYMNTCLFLFLCFMHIEKDLKNPEFPRRTGRKEWGIAHRWKGNLLKLHTGRLPAQLRVLCDACDSPQDPTGRSNPGATLVDCDEEIQTLLSPLLSG